MQVRAIKTDVFEEGGSLEAFIAAHIRRLPERSVLVVTSKIVALAEKRVVTALTKAQRAALIKRESASALKTRWVWLTIKDGMVVANAGIDESNADGKIILLPKDSFAAAQKLRNALKKRYKVKQLGVLITDSRIFPLRAGVMGLAVGYAGFKGLRDYRGTKDIFGRTLKMTRTSVADGLAAAAVVLMGEGAERHPIALIKDAPVEFSERTDRKELLIPIKDDLYFPLFRNAGF